MTDDLREFVASGVAVVVATGDAEGRPHIAYAWGPLVEEDGTLSVFIDRDRAGVTLEDLRTTERVAVTMSYPVSYRSVQFKGVATGTGDATPEERDHVARHREAFSTATALVGDPPNVIRNLWLDDVIRLSVRVERAFDQTPGPEAGKPL